MPTCYLRHLQVECNNLHRGMRVEWSLSLFPVERIKIWENKVNKTLHKAARSMLGDFYRQINIHRTVATVLLTLNMSEITTLQWSRLNHFWDQLSLHLYLLTYDTKEKKYCPQSTQWWTKYTMCITSITIGRHSSLSESGARERQVCSLTGNHHPPPMGNTYTHKNVKHCCCLLGKWAPMGAARQTPHSSEDTHLFTMAAVSPSLPQHFHASDASI